MSKADYNNPKENQPSINTETIWNILGDFWHLFDDKHVVEEIWGGYVEVINQFYSAFRQTQDSLNINKIPVFWECNWENIGPVQHAEDCDPLELYPDFTKRLAIDGSIISIPCLYKNPSMQGESAPKQLLEKTHYAISDGYIYFDADLQINGNYWAPVLKKNNNTVTKIFGAPLDIIDETTEDYYNKIIVIWRALWFGPTVSVIESGINAIMGYPYAGSDCVVQAVTRDDEDYYTVTLSDGTEFSSKLKPAVTSGQNVYRFDPIFQAVKLEDRINSPSWWVPTGNRTHIDSGQVNTDSGQSIDGWANSGNKASGLAQFHLFKVKIAYDSLNNAGEDLKYSRYFLERIKPVYTSFILEVDVDMTDELVDNSGEVLPTDSFVSEANIEPVDEYWPDQYIDIDTKKGLTGIKYRGL